MQATSEPALDAAPEPATDRRRYYLVVALTCLALVVIAVLANRAQPRPATVYGDDAWTLIGWRAHRFIDFRRAAYTSFGFVLLARFWLDVVGFSGVHARWLPMLLTLATGPTFLLVALRMRIRYPAALLGAVVIVTSPELVSMGTHVKQYSLDVLLGIVILGVAVALIRAPGSTRIWVAFGLVSIASLIGSFAIIGIVVAGAFVGLLAIIRDRHELARRAVATGLVTIAVVGVFAVAWYTFMLKPIIPTEALREFWRFAYIDLGDWGHTRQLFTWMFRDGFGTPLWLSVIVVAGATVLVAMRRPLHAVLFGTPLVIALAASVTEQAPFGAGRTDTWFYAPMIFMVVTALDIGLARAEHTERDGSSSAARTRTPMASRVALVVVAIALMLVFVARDFPGGPDAYGKGVFPGQANAIRLIEQLDKHRAPDDLVVLAPAFAFMYPLYAPQPLVTEESDRNVAGWYPKLDGVNTLISSNFRDPVPGIRKHVGDAATVWLLTTRINSVRWRVKPVMQELGFTHRRTFHGPGAVLEQWVRTP